MSVTGISYNPKQVEYFVLDYANENLKSQINNTNTTNDVKMKDKIFTSKTRMKTTIIIVVIIFTFGFSCAVAFLSYMYISHINLWTKYCHSSLCKRSAENLLTSMNLSVNPCDDFYKFACGNWSNHHSIPSFLWNMDWFDNHQILLLNNISKFLSINDSQEEPFQVHQARILYRSCLNSNRFDDTSFEPIETILQEVKLSTLPPPVNPSSRNFSWIHTAVLSKEKFKQDFFISFSISSDLKNRTVNKLHISKPDGPSLPVHRYYEKILKFKIKNYVNESDEELDLAEGEEYNVSNIYKETFIEYAANVFQYVLENTGVEWSEDIEIKFNESVEQLVLFHAAVEGLTEDYYGNISTIQSYISIDELQEKTDEISELHKSIPIIDWRQYFELIFENTENVTLDFETEDALIIVSDLEYIETIFDLLVQTPPSVIEFYMWWTVVSTLAPYTNSEMRKFNENFVVSLTGSEKRPRKLYCADVVNQLLGMAVAYSVVNDTAVNENMRKISEMVDDIQWAFRQNIKNLNWMDTETKNSTLKKINAMKKYIGYPKWLTDDQSLESYYEGVEMTETDFLGNILRETQRVYKEMLKQYRILNDYLQEQWISDPMDVNAYNWMEGNTITIPAGILQFPFYGQGIQALNYGAIGSIIGHEMTHSFDNTGKEYDDGGNMNPWWTNDTINEFKNRAQCFVNYYSTIEFPEGKTSKINGIRTLDENIADNGGMRNAFFAYRNYVNKNGPEPLLPELHQYTNEQLFFISFANTWCEHTSSSSEERSLNDEHSPDSVRVWGTLINSEEFAQTWKCKKGTPMNPSKSKCQIW